MSSVSISFSDMLTHKDSKFTPFAFDLVNGAKLTGIHHFPEPLDLTSDHLPLVIAIHGATCKANHYDIDRKHTASGASQALAIPFVAFNRPGYNGSSTILPLTEGSSYFEAEAEHLHRYVLPAIWNEFGKKLRASSIVLMCHSMSVPGAIIASGLHDKEGTPAYPLAGMIFSGFGCTPRQGAVQEFPENPADAPPGQIWFPDEFKEIFMGGAKHLQCCDTEVYKQKSINRLLYSRTRCSWKKCRSY